MSRIGLRSAWLLAGGLVGVAGLAGVAQAVNFEEPSYGFRSAILKLRTSGPMNESTEEVFIDQGGKIEARHGTMTVSGPFSMRQTQEHIHIRNGNILYAYDPKTKTATQRNLKEDAEALGMKDRDVKALGQEMIRQMGGKKLGNVPLTLASGQTVSTEQYAFEKLGSTVWFHQQFPVKSVTNMGGMEVTTEVTEMRLNVPIPKEKITLPEGTQITQAPNLKDIFGKMNAYQQSPEYREHQAQQRQERRAAAEEASADAQAGAPDMTSAVEALKGLFNR